MTTNPTPADQCAEAESGPSWRAAMGPERNPSPFSNQASAYGQGYRAGMKHPRVVTPADHATKPSERIRADAAFPDNPVSLLLAVLRYLDAQAMDNAGKSPGDDPLITSPGSACQCGHRCDSHHAGGGHCLSCPCKGFRYYTATRDSNSTHKWTDAPDGVWKRDPQEQEDDPDASADEGPFFPDSEFDDPGANDLADARAVVDRLRFIKGELWRRNADLFQQLREAQRTHVALRKAWDDASSQRTALQVSVLELTKSFEKAERTRDEWKRAAEKSGEQKEDLIEQRDEAWARIGQLKTELALSTESDLRITKKHNALEAELGGFRYNIEAVLFGSRDEHSLDEMIERASSLSVASANPAASPSGEVAAPSPVAPICAATGGYRPMGANLASRIKSRLVPAPDGETKGGGG